MLNEYYDVVETQLNTKLQSKSSIETPNNIDNFDNDVDDDGILTFKDLPKPEIKPDVTPESILEEINEFETLEKSENINSIKKVNDDINNSIDEFDFDKALNDMEKINNNTNQYIKQKHAEEMASHYALEAIQKHQALQITPDEKGFNIHIFVPFK